MVLWAGSDLLIFISYMLIPLAIGMVIRRRPDITYKALVALFAAFILLCGLTHAMGIVTLWYPIYPFTGAVKLATGIASVLTAIALFRLIPVLVRIPSPDRHDAVIQQLELTLADLSQARDQLEMRVKHRTEELREANSQLSHIARDAVQRSRNLVHVVSSLTRPGEEFGIHPEKFLGELRGRINALVVATTAVFEQSDHVSADLEYVIRRQIEPLFIDPARQLTIEGPKIDICAQGAQQISLVAWELASRFAQLGRSEQSRGRIALSWAITKQGAQGSEFAFE